MFRQIFGESASQPRAAEPEKTSPATPDPVARETTQSGSNPSGVANLSSTPNRPDAPMVPATRSEPLRRPFEEILPTPPSSPELRQTSAPLVSETIRVRREEVEKQLAITRRIQALSQKRAADLTTDELLDLWQNL